MKKIVFRYLFTLFLLLMFSYTPTLFSADKNNKDKTITVNAENTDRIIIVTKPQTAAAEKKEAKSDSKTDVKDARVKFNFSLAYIKNKYHELKKKHGKYFRGFSLLKIITLFIGLIITFIVARFVRWVIEDYFKRFARKTKTDIDLLTCEALGRPASLMVFAVGLFFSALPIVLVMPFKIYDVFEDVCLALGAAAIAWGIYRLVEVINHILTKLSEKTDNNIDNLIVAIVRKSLKVTIVVVSVLFIGQNILGLNITTLLAGAGVAGLAIAFAAQDTIANFFGSIMIILDRPFHVGDRIDVDGTEGVVEHVGFRSTRIRRLDGHLVTIPNKNVANSTVRNISKRPFIKQISNFTLVYDTPPEKMEKAMTILHEIYDNQEGMNMEEKPPLIFFNSFNDWALNIMVIVWYYPGDWGAFQNWNSGRNMEILKRFNAEGIEFAFPTNTTYLAYDQNRKLEVKVDS